MPYLRFLLLSLASCFAVGICAQRRRLFFQWRGDRIDWRLSATGQSAAGNRCHWDSRRSILIERFWLSKKVEEANPERLAGAGARRAGKIAGSEAGVSGAHSVSCAPRRTEAQKVRRRLRRFGMAERRSAECRSGRVRSADLRWLSRVVLFGDLKI